MARSIVVLWLVPIGAGRRVGEPADVEQFQPEQLDPSQHAVQRRLVKRADHYRVLAARLDPQVGKRVSDRFAEVTANADLVAVRGKPVCHVPSVGHSRMS